MLKSLHVAGLPGDMQAFWRSFVQFKKRSTRWKKTERREWRNITLRARMVMHEPDARMLKEATCN